MKTFEIEVVMKRYYTLVIEAEDQISALEQIQERIANDEFDLFPLFDDEEFDFDITEERFV